MFCQKQFQKLTRHQRRRHKEEPSVEAAMKLKAGSDEQILAFEKVRLTGDYHHNCNVLAVGEGELIVVRKPSKATPCVARRDQLIANFGAAIHEKVGIKKMPTTFLRGCDSWRAFSRRSAFRVKEKIRASKSSLTPPCLMLWWMQSRISAGLMQRRT